MHDSQVDPGSHRGAPVPWWVKIAAKLALKRLPIPHSIWSQLNIFRHSYSSGDADQQVRAVEASVSRFVAKTGRLPQTVLELGPGEITTCAVVYRALGIKRIVLVDVGDFGSGDVESYRRVAAAAAERGLAPPDLQQATDRADVFARCGAEYYINGLEDLSSLPGAFVDLVSSLAVIEHIRRHELPATFAELRRVMKDDGLARHGIDFQDHLGGKLANLRFSPAIWESEWMASSGFYTNRVSASQVVALMHDAGFEVEIEARGLWPQPPTTRNRIAADLRAFWSDEDLRICSLSLTASAAKPSPQ